MRVGPSSGLGTSTLSREMLILEGKRGYVDEWMVGCQRYGL